MLKTFLTLRSILTPSERRQTIMLFVMMLGMAFLETVGVASIMPFIAVLSDPQIIETNRWLSATFEYSGASSTHQFMVLLGIASFLLLITSLAFKAATQWAQIHFAQMRIHALGCRMMEAYLGQPYQWFLGRHSSRLATTVLAEVNKVISGSLFPAMQVVAYSLVALFLVTLLLILNPVIALGMGLAVGGIYLTLYLLVRKRLGRIGAIRLAANRERYRVTQETFGGFKDVKVNGLERIMVDRFKDPSWRLARQEAKSQVLSQIPNYAIQALVYGGIITILLVMMTLYGSLEEALPVFATFAFAGYRLVPAAQSVYRQTAELRVAQPALESLAADIHSLQPSAIPRDTGPDRRMSLQGAIELRDVTFAYAGADRPALDEVSLRIPARATVGLVGTTGSGKTTMVDVILGLLWPQKGCLVVDEQPLTPENVRAWQRSVGYVPQQIYLADESVAANIAFGLPPEKLDMEAVERAARIANLHDFVIDELPQKYDTIVGERGVRLSGGQRQRIGIARALYHDPDVLLLDEATSALDNVTESAVMSAVNELGNQKTIIMIAHRLTTVRNCDHIFLLEHGRVAAEGTFDELVAQSTQFRAMALGDSH